MSIKSKVKSLFELIFKANPEKELSEKEFYENLFIRHPSWNTKEPNQDESKRWDIIETYINNQYQNNQKLDILDLGCGRGWLSNLLSKYGKVTGIEPVEKVVDYARKIFPEINFLAGSTDELLERNLENNFDLIVCSEVIEHVQNEDKAKFVKDINRLLVDGGICIISTPRKEIQLEWLKDRNNTQPIEDWISESDLKKIFDENGFTRTDVKRISLKGKNTEAFFDVYQICCFQKTQNFA